MRLKHLLRLYEEIDREQILFIGFSFVVALMSFIVYLFCDDCFGAIAVFTILGTACSGLFAAFSAYSFYKKRIVFKSIMRILKKGERKNEFGRNNSNLQSKS